MRLILAFLALSFSLLPSLAGSAAVEKEAAIDGSQYAVVAPVFDGSGGSLSFLRLYNGSGSATTFSITVINTSNGVSVGATTINVPAYASPQYPVTQAASDGSVFALAGVSAASGASYGLYIQNSNALTGYQHVTFNQTSTLFENNSVCTTPMSQQLASSNKIVLTNVHSSSFASNYPSYVTIHNYTTTATTVTLTLRNAASGASVGQYNQTVSANGTLTLAETTIESQLAVGSPPLHFNLEVTKSGGGTVPVTVTHTIHNAKLGGDINMAEACAINAVPTTIVQAAPIVPTAYCGTLSFPTQPYPLNSLVDTFVVSVAPNGKINATLYGAITSGNTTYYSGQVYKGALNGSSWTVASTLDGGAGSGTLSNGTFTGTFINASGLAISVSGSTSACYN